MALKQGLRSQQSRRKGLRLWLASGIALCAALFAGQLAAQNEPGPIQGEGIVQKVDLAASLLIVTGFEYDVAPDAAVQIAGRASSLAGLTPGMKIRYFSEPVAPTGEDAAPRERILAIEQMPDSFLILEH